jgi:hypothetical protein
VYQHGLHNFAVVAYDPALIGATPVRAATLSAVPLAQGDSVYMVVLGKNQRLGTPSFASVCLSGEGTETYIYVCTWVGAGLFLSLSLSLCT